MTIENIIKEALMSSYEYWSFIGEIGDETVLKDINVGLDDIKLIDEDADSKDVIRLLSSNVNFERRDDRYYLSNNAVTEIKKIEENGMDEDEALSNFLSKNLVVLDDNKGKSREF